MYKTLSKDKGNWIMNMNDKIGYDNPLSLFMRICYRIVDMFKDWRIKRELSGKGLK